MESGHMHPRHSMIVGVGVLYEDAHTIQDLFRRRICQTEVLKDFDPLEPAEAEQGKLVLFPWDVLVLYPQWAGRTISFNTMPG